MARINIERHTGNLYRLLGVEPDASADDITRAYRRLARRYHPDVDASPRAADRFITLTHAYRTLIDPAARARYDAGLAQQHTPDDPHRRKREQAQQHVTAWANRWPPPAAPHPAFWLGGPHSSADPFHIGRDPDDAVAAGGEEADVEISVEEAYRGAFRTITVSGHGRTDSTPVTIPPGAITGQRIPVPLCHLPGGRGIPKVVLRVRMLPHERYRVEGRDVHVQLPLSPWEAALGTAATIDIPTNPVAVAVPPCTSSGHVLTVPGEGIPNPAGPSGDLHVQARIVLPKNLTAAERQLFTRLAATSDFSPRAP